MKFKANPKIDYLELLSTIGSVKPVYEYDGKINVLRHDVDHDLLHAFKMASIEAEHGIRSTYYLLPAENQKKNYYGETHNGRPHMSGETRKLAVQIQGMGHEIGLHSNLVTLCLQSKLEPDYILKIILEDFKSIGITIKTTASHGDTQARDGGYINYQIFEECGKKDFPFKQIKLSDYGLQEAYFYKRVNYLSDSGGLFALCDEVGCEWNKGETGCERNVNDENKIFEFSKRMGKPSQILLHPIWWV